MVRSHILFIFGVIAALLFAGAFPSAAVAGPAAPGQARRPPSPKQQKALVERQNKIRKAQLKDVQLKIQNLHRLIREVNGELSLRTSDADIFDRKRSLENQLRDIVTLFALTGRAMDESRRLRQEVKKIRQGSRTGPVDARRLQLVNFLEARRREYIFFATR